MKKAQFDKPIFFILALVVVALVLYVGYMGINYMIQVQKDNEVTSFWNSIDRAVNRNMNYGALETVQVYLPRTDAICFFNVTIVDQSDKICELFDEDNNPLPFSEQEAKIDVCNRDEMIDYWKIINPTAEPDNIVLSNGLTKRSVRAQPANGKYQCYEGTIIRLRLEGQGTHVNIGPAS